MFVFALILSLSGAALADGACCADGYCSEEAESVCNGGGGSFYGDGTTCGDPFVDCSGTAPGACCIDDTCEEMIEEFCIDAGGTWSEQGSVTSKINTPPTCCRWQTDAF